MMKAKIAMICVFTMIASGCASYRPIVDMQGVDRARYEQDLKECQRYAEQISPAKSTAAGAGIGAGLGALVGVLVGATLNVNVGQMAGFGAAIGGLNGAAVGGAESAKAQVQIIQNCMRGRGYSVLR
jgi:hypothetical protein